jgi:hypothetical protein
MIDEQNIAEMNTILNKKKGLRKVQFRANNKYEFDHWFFFIQKCCRGDFLNFDEASHIFDINNDNNTNNLNNQIQNDAEFDFKNFEISLDNDDNIEKYIEKNDEKKFKTCADGFFIEKKIEKKSFMYGDLEKKIIFENSKKTSNLKFKKSKECVLTNSYLIEIKNNKKKFLYSNTFFLIGGNIKKIKSSKENTENKFVFEIEEGLDLSSINLELIKKAKKIVGDDKIYEILNSLEKSLKTKSLFLLKKNLNLVNFFEIKLNDDFLLTINEKKIVLETEELIKKINFAIQFSSFEKLLELGDEIKQKKINQNLFIYKKYTNLMQNNIINNNIDNNEIYFLINTAKNLLKINKDFLFKKYFKLIIKHKKFADITVEFKKQIIVMMLQYVVKKVLKFSFFGICNSDFVCKILKFTINTVSILNINFEIISLANIIIFFNNHNLKITPLKFESYFENNDVNNFNNFYFDFDDSYASNGKILEIFNFFENLKKKFDFLNAEFELIKYKKLNNEIKNIAENAKNINNIFSIKLSNNTNQKENQEPHKKKTFLCFTDKNITEPLLQLSNEENSFNVLINEIKNKHSSNNFDLKFKKDIIANNNTENQISIQAFNLLQIILNFNSNDVNFNSTDDPTTINTNNKNNLKNIQLIHHSKNVNNVHINTNNNNSTNKQNKTKKNKQKSEMNNKTIITTTTIEIEDVILNLIETVTMEYPLLKNEFYFQLCKQLTNNFNLNSCLNGWLLFSIYLHAFLPTEDAVPYIQNFIVFSLQRCENDIVSFFQSHIEKRNNNNNNNNNNNSDDDDEYFDSSSFKFVEKRVVHFENGGDNSNETNTNNNNNNFLNKNNAYENAVSNSFTISDIKQKRKILHLIIYCFKVLMKKTCTQTLLLEKQNKNINLNVYNNNDININNSNSSSDNDDNDNNNKVNNNIKNNEDKDEKNKMKTNFEKSFLFRRKSLVFNNHFVINNNNNKNKIKKKDDDYKNNISSTSTLVENFKISKQVITHVFCERYEKVNVEIVLMNGCSFLFSFSYGVLHSSFSIFHALFDVLITNNNCSYENGETTTKNKKTEENEVYLENFYSNIFSFDDDNNNNYCYYDDNCKNIKEINLFENIFHGKVDSDVQYEKFFKQKKFFQIKNFFKNFYLYRIDATEYNFEKNDVDFKKINLQPNSSNIVNFNDDLQWELMFKQNNNNINNIQKSIFILRQYCFNDDQLYEQNDFDQKNFKIFDEDLSINEKIILKKKLFSILLTKKKILDYVKIDLVFAEQVRFVNNKNNLFCMDENYFIYLLAIQIAMTWQKKKNRNKKNLKKIEKISTTVSNEKNINDEFENKIKKKLKKDQTNIKKENRNLISCKILNNVDSSMHFCIDEIFNEKNKTNLLDNDEKFFENFLFDKNKKKINNINIAHVDTDNSNNNNLNEYNSDDDENDNNKNTIINNSDSNSSSESDESSSSNNKSINDKNDKKKNSSSASSFSSEYFSSDDADEEKKNSFVKNKLNTNKTQNIKNNNNYINKKLVNEKIRYEPFRATDFLTEKNLHNFQFFKDFLKSFIENNSNNYNNVINSNELLHNNENIEKIINLVSVFHEVALEAKTETYSSNFKHLLKKTFLDFSAINPFVGNIFFDNVKMLTNNLTVFNENLKKDFSNFIDIKVLMSISFGFFFLKKKKYFFVFVFL